MFRLRDKNDWEKKIGNHKINKRVLEYRYWVRPNRRVVPMAVRDFR